VSDETYPRTGRTLTSGYTGSASTYCNLCDSHVRWLAIEVDEVIYEIEETA